MTTGEATSFPSRRAAAARNRDKILSAARDAFAEPGADVSMAQIARRAGVGMATLYRNFPGRRELLEGLYAEEVSAISAAATSAADERAPGDALLTWLRRLIDFMPSKRLIVAELLEHAGDGSSTVPSQRHRAIAAGRPLLEAAQDAGEIRDDITMDQIMDMIVALAKVPGAADHLEPMVRTLLDGLRRG